MVTIENLEVRFDVEGEGQEAAFVRLFEKHAKEWSKRERDERRKRADAARERSLGDRSGAEAEP